MASVDDIWLVDFGEPYPGEPADFRPAIVLGPPASFGDDMPFVLLIPLSSTGRGLSIHVEVEPSSMNGLDVTCYAQCEVIRSVSVKRLVHQVGRLSRLDKVRIDEVVKILLGF